MKKTLLTLIISVSFSVAIAEEELCPLELLKDSPYTDLKCQFYLGTTAYRAGAYDVAATHWQRVLNSSNTSPHAVEFKTSSRATLAYLKYFGLGVPSDRKGAVEDWLQAVELGQIEARRQLGFAYSDPEFKDYDPVLGLAWYKSVLLVHPDRSRLNETDQAVYDDAIAGISELEGKLSRSEIEMARKKSEDLASSNRR